MAESELPQRLSYEDATFYYFDRDEFPYNVGSVGIYEGLIAFDAYRWHVERRLDRVPRYRQRLVSVPLDIALPAWHDDPDFSIENHVTHAVLPEPGDEDQLRSMAADFFATPLNRDRPLWEIRLVHGLSGDRTAHLARIHHSMIDGISGVELMGAILDVEQHPADEPASDRWQRPAAMPGPFARFVDAAFDRLVDQIDTAENVANGLVDPGSVLRNVRAIVGSFWASRSHLFRTGGTPWSTRLTSPRRLAWQSLPLEEVRRISKTLGGSVNDVMLAVLAGAFARYVSFHGVQLDNEVRALIPVNVRTKAEQRSLGNRVSFMLAGLPVGLDDPIARFRAIHSEIGHLKEIDQAGSLDKLAAVLGQTPPTLQRRLGERLRLPNFVSDLVCTNVPGPEVPLYCAGHRMIDHYPWVPIGWRMGLGVAIMSYDQRLSVTLTGDASVLADIDRLATFVGEAFDELRGAALGNAEPAAEAEGALPAMYADAGSQARQAQP